jgi:hypothetical protein
MLISHALSRRRTERIANCSCVYFVTPAKAGPRACPWIEQGATAGTLAAPGFLAFAGMTVRLDIGVSIASPVPRREAAPLFAAMASGVITARSWSGAASATNYRKSGLVVCPACSIAWGWKSPVQPDGGEGLAKHKGVIARWRLKAVWSKTAARRTEIGYQASLAERAGD